MRIPFGQASAISITALAFALSVSPSPAFAQDQPTPLEKPATADALKAGFQDPPASARPLVWWHWLDENVSKDGIRKDLEWMKRIGVGGLQQFDASMMTPKIVETPLPFMSSGWKDAFRYAVSKADELGLDFSIASSPGFSETGGPWVPSEDGMKKVVWSELTLHGPHPFHGQLPSPPNIPGPFQSISRAQIGELGKTTKQIDPVYKDIGVFAYPVEKSDQVLPAMTNAAGEKVDAQILTDNLYDKSVTVPVSNKGQTGGIIVTYDRPMTIRSASMHILGKTALADVGLASKLESSVDGVVWTPVAQMPVGLVPTTVSFQPVTAKWFRLALIPEVKRNLMQNPPAAGAAAAAMLGGNPAPVQSARVTEFTLSQESRIDRFENKAAFSAAQDYQALDEASPPDSPGIPSRKVINLTGRMKSDGTLDWTPPSGTWRIVRLGYSLTGATNHPATQAATGIEVDKLDAAAVRRYMNAYLGMYRDVVGPDLIGKRGIKGFLNDSIEAGDSNWTGDMIAQFKRLRGYDPTPWLPTLTGVVVESRHASDAFLFDFRQTIADLIADKHYGTIADIAHANGLISFAESLEGGRTQIGDDMTMRSHADVPMAAMWAFDQKSGPRPGYVVDIKGAASVANLYGRKVVAAESLTALARPWADAPAELRSAIDLEFATGANLPVIQTSVHQPTDQPPGLPFFIIAQDFYRLNTWAEMAKPWMDYLARNSFLLQQGRNVADVAYFYGEEPPLVGQFADKLVEDAPLRYAYDFLNPDVLNKLSVERGVIVSPGGARYRLLYLGRGARRMTLRTLHEIARLADLGATVVGDAPSAWPSTRGSQAQFDRIIQKLWSAPSSRVMPGHDPEAALAAIGVTPDFSYRKSRPNSELLFIHRQLADGDLYFVTNRRDFPETTEVRVRVTGKAPELWHADTGRIEPVSYRVEGAETIVPLTLDPESSVHIVFRNPTSTRELTLPEVHTKVVASLPSHWNVTFQPNRGAPASIKMDALTPLEKNKDPGIRYFSGEATYTTTFASPADWQSGQPLWLDLGEVHEVAEVRINGKFAGSAWHRPYRLNIAGLTRNGENTIEVKVANLWVNRLIGDVQPGAKKVAATSVPTYLPNAPLRPSGLIGPVQLSTPVR